MKKPLIAILIYFSILYASSTAYSKTTIDDISNVIATSEEEKLINDFQGKMDLNGPAYANAFYFANTLGYAIGSATLGDFPHFQIGVTANAGLTHMENFKHSKSGVYEGSLPGIGVAPAITFGMGIAKGFDFIGKFMVYNFDLYEPPTNFAAYQLKKCSLYSIGGRLRYNLVKEKKIIPFLFSFSGITLVGGGDMTRGLLSIGGEYSMPFGTVNIPAGGGTITPTLDSQYLADISWYQLSGTAQALAYFKFFSLISMFTGLGCSTGYGWFNVDFNATGTLSAPGFTDFANVAFSSKNKYHPQSVLPTYIIGFEIDAPVIKIVTESQVNLRNRADISVSLGVRIQI